MNEDTKYKKKKKKEKKTETQRNSTKRNKTQRNAAKLFSVSWFMGTPVSVTNSLWEGL
jgi:hypothetical protein